MLVKYCKCCDFFSCCVEKIHDDLLKFESETVSDDKEKLKIIRDPFTDEFTLLEAIKQLARLELSLEKQDQGISLKKKDAVKKDAGAARIAAVIVNSANDDTKQQEHELQRVTTTDDADIIFSDTPVRDNAADGDGGYDGDAKEKEREHKKAKEKEKENENEHENDADAD